MLILCGEHVPNARPPPASQTIPRVYLSTVIRRQRHRKRARNAQLITVSVARARTRTQSNMYSLFYIPPEHTHGENRKPGGDATTKQQQNNCDANFH